MPRNSNTTIDGYSHSSPTWYETASAEDSASAAATDTDGAEVLGREFRSLGLHGGARRSSLRLQLGGLATHLQQRVQELTELTFARLPSAALSDRPSQRLPRFPDALPGASNPPPCSLTSRIAPFSGHAAASSSEGYAAAAAGDLPFSGLFQDRVTTPWSSATLSEASASAAPPIIHRVAVREQDHEPNRRIDTARQQDTTPQTTVRADSELFFPSAEEIRSCLTKNLLFNTEYRAEKGITKAITELAATRFANKSMGEGGVQMETTLIIADFANGKDGYTGKDLPDLEKLIEIRRSTMLLTLLRMNLKKAITGCAKTEPPIE